jgi:hypothetical protein
LPGDEAQEGGFAAAVGTDEADAVAVVDEQADVVEQGAFAHVDGDVFQGD